MDLAPLASIRRAHETDRAKSGIRTKGALHSETGSVEAASAEGGIPGALSPSVDSENPGDSSSSTTPPIPASIRREIIREMHQTLREEQSSRAVGTGLERQTRWGATTAGAATTGNTANAASAAGQRATAASTDTPLYA